MTDEQIEKIIKANMNLQMNLAGIRADFEEASQRTWVGLTDKEAMQICVDCGCLSEDWLTLLDAIETELRRKNEARS